MITMFINRLVSDVALGTLSAVSFSHHDDTFHYLEPPWLDNIPNRSCVPPGVYAGVWAYSRKWGNVYHLVGGTVVLRRGDMKTSRAARWGCIAGHPANWHQELEGCGSFGMSSRRNHQGHRMRSYGKRSHYVGASVKALGRVHDLLERTPVIQVVIGSDL